jgi:uncharacterized SAM-binding protein YcdF (DUF218 family)
MICPHSLCRTGSSPSRSSLRSVVLLLGIFSAANLIGGTIFPGFDATIWWLDLPPLHTRISFLLLLAVTAALLLYAFDLIRTPALRGFCLACLAIAALIALFNTGSFFWLLARGSIASEFPLPFSLPIAVILALACRKIVRSVDRSAGTRLSPFAFVAAAILFPLLQMLCFGGSDYSRPADAIVVFGARAYADGRASIALADRVRTAYRLYREGYAPLLIFSGGPADGTMHETEAMRRLAISLGVPDSAIVLDRDGVSTSATAVNSRIIFESLGVRRAIAVSNFYHLPRIKLAFQRQGIDIYTVPAEESRSFSGTPWQLIREAAGLGIYYLAPLWEPARPRIPSSITVDSPALLT